MSSEKTVHPRLRIAVWCIWLLGLAGITIRLTMKDTFPVLSTVYYATPTGLLTVAMVTSAIIWRRLGHREKSLVSAALAVICFLWWHQTSFVRHKSTYNESDVRVVFWNVANGKLGWPRVMDMLVTLDPDVIAVVEVGGDNANERLLRKTFPNYAMSDTKGGLVVLCRGKISKTKYESFEGTYRYKQAEVTVGDTKLRVLVVDVQSNPLMIRRKPLQEIAEVADGTAAQPTLVMGDFNTPGDSVHFTPLRRSHVNVAESYGTGYLPTWPLPFPVLQIDHIWANRNVHVSDCAAAWTWRSDHRLLLTHIRVEEPPDGSTRK